MLRGALQQCRDVSRGMLFRRFSALPTVRIARFPANRLTIISDIQRMLRMAGLGQSKVKQRTTSFAQESLHSEPAVQMLPMLAPGANDAAGPGDAVENRGIVVRSYRILGEHHRLGVGCAPGEDVGYAEGAESQTAGSAFATLDRRVVLAFGGRRGVEHDEDRAPASYIPDPGQQVAISQAVRIDRFRVRISLLECAENQLATIAAGNGRIQAGLSATLNTRVGCSSPPR